MTPPAQVVPPLARITSPVTAVLAAEQRKAIVGTTSSGASSRPAEHAGADAGLKARALAIVSDGLRPRPASPP